MKKTALQQAFNLLEELHPSFFDIRTEKGSKFINTFHKFIEIERQQIIEAHGNKYKKSSGTSNYEYILTGEDYYNQTYNK